MKQGLKANPAMRVLKYILRSHWLVISTVLLLVFACWAGALSVIAYLITTGDGLMEKLLGCVGGVCIVWITARTLGKRPLIVLSVLLKLRLSIPTFEREVTSLQLDQAVKVTFDEHGIPTVDATTRLDAFRALGYVTARDRLFQMDILRKHGGGKLSELLGPAAFKIDLDSRELGFSRSVEKLCAELPEGQQQLLQAYTQGVNAYISGMKSLPFEFLVLNHRPEQWRVEDCLLVFLQMFRALSDGQNSKRMLTIMEQVLPPEVVAFFTPDYDPYSEMALGGEQRDVSRLSIPVEALASVLGKVRAPNEWPESFIRVGDLHPGSNCWAADHTKTSDGRAILANDLHLDLGVPNLFYRARLRYEEVDISGGMIPGIPAVLVGSNQHVAWGVTNMPGDCLDIIKIEIDPADKNRYMTPDGWRSFECAEEIISVKGGGSYIIEFRDTIWGPVSTDLLLGEQVAFRWSALDSKALNLELINIDGARRIEDAQGVINRWGGPPLNVILADETGRIAYTVCGKLPMRRGSNGSTMQSWANGANGWNGYISPASLPRLVDPPDGYLVNANNRGVKRDYPFTLGTNFSSGHRAHQIIERLRRGSGLNEADMFELQLDSTSNFHEFYRQLALDTLSDTAAFASGELQNLRASIIAWDGKAEADSQGLAVLIAFRHRLVCAVFTPFLAACKMADPQFVYCWRNFETPLRLLLVAKVAEILPGQERFADWDSLILQCLNDAAKEVRRSCEVKDFRQLKWGRVNIASILHPIASALPRLGKLLNMPIDPLPGCMHSICVSSPHFGAVLRMVVSPVLQTRGILQMPCGQSGHPLSPNYSDQHRSWIRRWPAPFLPGKKAASIAFKPAAKLCVSQ